MALMNVMKVVQVYIHMIDQQAGPNEVGSTSRVTVDTSSSQIQPTFQCIEPVHKDVPRWRTAFRLSPAYHNSRYLKARAGNSRAVGISRRQGWRPQSWCLARPLCMKSLHGGPVVKVRMNSTGL